MTCQRPKLMDGKCGYEDCPECGMSAFINKAGTICHVQIQHHALTREGWRYLFAGLAAAAIITRDHAITLRNAGLKGIETADALLEELEKK